MRRVIFNRISILSAFCNEVSVCKVLFVSLLHCQNVFVIAPQITSFYSTLGVSAGADFICTLCIADLIEAEHYISVTDIADRFTAIKDRTQGLAAIHHVQFLYAHGSVDNFDRRANCRYSIVKEEKLLRIISQRTSDALINLIPGTKGLAYIFPEKRPVLDAGNIYTLLQ